MELSKIADAQTIAESNKVNEYVEDGIVKIIFVKSKENDADIFATNLNGELHATHSSKFVKKK